MPTVTISVEDVGGIGMPAGGGTFYLPKRELRVWGYFGTELRMRRAVFDTGAPACVPPHRVWSRLALRGDITWISSGATGPFIRVFGGSYPFRLGRVRLKLIDLSNELTPSDVTAICTDDPQTAPAHLQLPILIGLADVMRGRVLRVEAAADGQVWSATLGEQ
ncbi:hypothetical protein R5W24_005956 [Gemmata sp. JC717]|uniref:hypothetical protein n=1 Tax=Gemmata algarum TaxID=2975278 RepID=UPI0021BA9BF4|nr:hypothetical protein [Gemmata algarum]MDY3556783.1 hypothetical protein [Gemmata algarum]